MHSLFRHNTNQFSCTVSANVKLVHLQAARSAPAASCGPGTVCHTCRTAPCGRDAPGARADRRASRSPCRTAHTSETNDTQNRSQAAVVLLDTPKRPSGQQCAELSVVFTVACRLLYMLRRRKASDSKHKLRNAKVAQQKLYNCESLTRCFSSSASQSSHVLFVLFVVSIRFSHLMQSPSAKTSNTCS